MPTLLIMPTLSFASQSSFIQWNSTNIQLLRGGEYELGSQQRTIMTIEHANRWSYGDFYIFGDKDWRDVGDSAYYFEPTLRVSFNKLYGEKLTSGIVKDVFIAGQIEKPKGQRPRTLIGLSADLDVAGFRFFKTMLFLRDNPDLVGDTINLLLLGTIHLVLLESTFSPKGLPILLAQKVLRWLTNYLCRDC